MILLYVVGFILYLIIGYFVIKAIEGDINGEVFGALIVIWPLLFLGVWVKRILSHLGLYNKWMDRIFFLIIIILVIIILLLYFFTLFNNLVK